MPCPKCKSEKEFRYKNKHYCSNCGEEIKGEEGLSLPKEETDFNKQFSSVFSDMTKHLNIKGKVEYKEENQIESSPKIEASKPSETGKIKDDLKEKKKIIKVRVKTKSHKKKEPKNIVENKDILNLPEIKELPEEKKLPREGKLLTAPIRKNDEGEEVKLEAAEEVLELIEKESSLGNPGLVKGQSGGTEVKTPDTDSKQASNSNLDKSQLVKEYFQKLGQEIGKSKEKQQKVSLISKIILIVLIAFILVSMAGMIFILFQK